MEITFYCFTRFPFDKSFFLHKPFYSHQVDIILWSDIDRKLIFGTCSSHIRSHLDVERASGFSTPPINIPEENTTVLCTEMLDSDYKNIAPVFTLRKNHKKVWVDNWWILDECFYFMKNHPYFALSNFYLFLTIKQFSSIHFTTVACMSESEWPY